MKTLQVRANQMRRSLSTANMEVTYLQYLEIMTEIYIPNHITSRRTLMGISVHRILENKKLWCSMKKDNRDSTLIISYLLMIRTIFTLDTALLPHWMCTHISSNSYTCIFITPVVIICGIINVRYKTVLIYYCWWYRLHS